MKYLLVLLIVVVVLALMFGRRRGAASPGTRSAQADAEGMVRCAQCGIHLPRSEALLQSGRTYCSTAHLEQDRGR